MRQRALVLHWCTCFLLAFRLWIGGKQSSLTFSLAWRRRRGYSLVEIRFAVLQFTSTLSYFLNADLYLYKWFYCCAGMRCFAVVVSYIPSTSWCDPFCYRLNCHRHSVFVSVQCFFLHCFNANLLHRTLLYSITDIWTYLCTCCISPSQRP